MMADSRSHHIASSLPFGKKQAYVHSDVNAFTDYIGNSIETIQNYAPSIGRHDRFHPMGPMVGVVVRK